MNAIRPALETLSELDEGRFMDKLAVKIHDAVSAVTAFGKPATIKVEITIDTLKKNIVEPVITMEADISSKLPKPESPKALFFVDSDGNPTTKQQRQGGLDLKIAGRDHNQAQGAA